MPCQYRTGRSGSIGRQYLHAQPLTRADLLHTPHPDKFHRAAEIIHRDTTKLRYVVPKSRSKPPKSRRSTPKSCPDERER
eukprot:1394380-Rhodomonas_salina.1